MRRRHPFDTVFVSSIVGLALFALVIWLDPLGIVNFLRAFAFRNVLLSRIYQFLRIFSVMVMVLIALLAYMRLFTPGALSGSLARMPTSTGPSRPNCSFCKRSHVDAGPLVEGPRSVFICAECCQRLSSQLAEATSAGKCAFCRKHSSKVGALVASDEGVLICGKCVALMTRIQQREGNIPSF